MYKNLKNIRKERGYTLEQIGKILGVAKSTYFKKERGELKISIEEAKKIADFYEMSIDDLFFKNYVS